RLSEAELGRVDRALREGPRVHGFATDLWTLDRVATVIEATTGVRYHPGHVWKLLRDRLGWSRQRPARRAVELIGLVDDGTLPGIGSLSILHGRSAAT
ncbi:MAG: winged helix-turn-helix domain-containing protein, partial [Actinomycetota bacterium]|nr:winged helix-turn-helix domain-containing protein [Actinomycetota bacterium]